MFFQCTYNGEMKLLRVPSAVRLSGFYKIVREQFGMDEDADVSIQYLFFFAFLYSVIYLKSNYFFKSLTFQKK